ncbi:hypothetical protein GOBAR_AA34381 [Gossypium barbadense]|uniref:Piwi domain-containing protein n=1 Tax=Gossypium barbadense TaxID=3634 RepID=A0A2P5W5E7_GOSBA|nr:hypothetical protein GOBAR_AA34381 [Gossypium barbadense]
MALVRVKDQCFTNLLLKINTKLGGLNYMLVIEQTPSIPVVSKVPIIILGMDALFGSPEQSDIPSIATVVSFMKWPLISSYRASGKRKPDQIIIFRDGVSKSQFNQVLNIELDQGSPDNVSPGTVINNKIYHARNIDFYLCAHTGMIGATRSTHYHVLLGQIGFSTDDLQELVHAISKKRYRHICCGPYSLSSFGNVTVRAVYRV